MSTAQQRLASAIRQEQPFKNDGHAAVIALLLTADQVRRAFDHTIGAEADLTQQQYNVLRILRGAGPDGLPTLEVAERMIQQSPGMTRMMDRLAAKGLIGRQRSTEDRRQVRCVLSPAGHALLASLDPCVEAFDDRIDQALSGPQKTALLSALERVRLSLTTP